MECGAKLEVVKSGTVDPFNTKGGVRVNVGQIWDLVSSPICGVVLRKLNRNGSSTRLLNGISYASRMVSGGLARVLDESDPKAIAHGEMEAKCKASFQKKCKG